MNVKPLHGYINLPICTVWYWKNFCVILNGSVTYALLYVARHHLECRDAGSLSREPEEVHSRHKDDLRRTQESGRSAKPDRLPTERQVENKLWWRWMIGSATGRLLGLCAAFNVVLDTVDSKLTGLVTC